MAALPKRRHGCDYHGGFRWAVKWGACAGCYACLLAFLVFAVFGPTVAQCVRWP